MDRPLQGGRAIGLRARVRLLSSLSSARGARFRHVVFDPRSTGRRAMDLARHRHAGENASLAPDLASPAAPATSPLREDDAAFVLWLFEQAGVDGRVYRSETLRRRLNACLRALRVRDSAEARALLERDPARIQLALGAFVIGVTSFFRDAGVFDHLTYSALANLPRPPAPPRIWSAGCSDGEELYSVAIVLSEMNLLDGATLLGTDCRAHAIGAARRGRYGPNSMKDVPDSWRHRYFIRDGATWTVSARLREAAQWRRGDLTQVQEPGAWDIILCRNMAMYLLPEVAGRLWERLEQSLRPGGFLVLGKAERPVSTRHLSLLAPCIYRRV